MTQIDKRMPRAQAVPLRRALEPAGENSSLFTSHPNVLLVASYLARQPAAHIMSCLDMVKSLIV